MLSLEFTSTDVELKRIDAMPLEDILELPQLKGYFPLYHLDFNEDHLLVCSKRGGKVLDRINLSEESKSYLLERKPSSTTYNLKLDFVLLQSDNKTYEDVIGSLLHFELYTNTDVFLSHQDKLYIFFVLETLSGTPSNITFREEKLILLPEIEKFIRGQIQFEPLEGENKFAVNI